MPSKIENLKEELKKRNSERKSSPLEDWFVRCFNEVGIYNYVREHQINNYFLDFAWPDIKFAVEADGDLYHFDRKDKDRIRDNELKKEGWEIYRVDSKDAWGLSRIKKHLLYIYEKTQETKTPSYATIELLSDNDPNGYIRSLLNTKKEEKEERLSENRIYYCEKCDSFYSREFNCQCK